MGRKSVVTFGTVLSTSGVNVCVFRCMVRPMVFYMFLEFSVSIDKIQDFAQLKSAQRDQISKECLFEVETMTQNFPLEASLRLLRISAFYTLYLALATDLFMTQSGFGPMSALPMSLYNEEYDGDVYLEKVATCVSYSPYIQGFSVSGHSYYCSFASFQ